MDDIDDCVGAYDECGVCNGDGVDADDDGVCDDVDECVGDYDPCGICNGDGTWCLTASITLGAATTTSLEVLYDSPLNIGGFQFNISGANVTGGSGGAAEANGFQVSAGGSTVLGFAFDGSVVPAGSGVLTNLAITATDFTGCISDVVLSDDDGDQFGTENANCVDIPLPNEINLGSATDGTVEVYYSSLDPIGGFQFNISGANVTGGSGGAAGDAGFTISTDGNIVLGLSFGGNSINPGAGLLTTLNIDITDFNGCLTDVVVSSPDAIELDFTGNGCTDFP